MRFFPVLCVFFITFAIAELNQETLNERSKEAEEIEEEIQEENEDERKPREIDTARIYEQGETRDFLDFLKNIRYDHRQVPEEENGEPVQVNVSVVVSNIRSITEVTMDYSLELFYRESWRDRRLQYSKEKFRNKTEISLHESYSEFLWQPDTFVPNAITSKNPRRGSMAHRSLLRLRHDGSVLYSRRLSLVATCAMDLTLFPFDTQICKLGIESYGYTANQVLYQWSSGQIPALKLQPIELPDFKVQEAYVTRRLESYATGDYSRLHVCFVFTRTAGFCFLQLFIPSTAVVFTCWVSLWMVNETSFQDMVSIILTITFLMYSYNEVMPRVSYIKAMDVYLGVCFCFVFLSLIKLVIAKYLSYKCHQNEEIPTVSSMKEESENTAFMEGKRRRGKCVVTRKFLYRFNAISQLIFFFAFAIFAVVYFIMFPNRKFKASDADCDRSEALWFAEIQ